MRTILTVTGAVWLVFEVTLMVRDRVRGKGGTAGDRGTRSVIIAVVVGAILAADVLSGVIPARSPLHIGDVRTAGQVIVLVIIWGGLLLRAWAVVTLGRAFRTTVEVDTGQAVVSRGPYRLIRHPSYTGMLLIVIGFGLADGTWPGLALCVVLPIAATLRRVRVEEAELGRVLGEPYRAYQERTKRLVPGLW